MDGCWMAAGYWCRIEKWPMCDGDWSLDMYALSQVDRVIYSTYWSRTSFEFLLPSTRAFWSEISSKFICCRAENRKTSLSRAGFLGNSIDDGG